MGVWDICEGVAGVWRVKQELDAGLQVRLALTRPMPHLLQQAEILLSCQAHAENLM